MTLTREHLKKLRSAPVTDGKNRLRHARELLGLTQVDVAQQMGVAQPQLSDWERGRYAITVDSARRLADFFGCSIEDLFPARTEAA